MQITLNPDPLRAGQIGSLHVVLDTGDEETDYTFDATPGDDTPFNGGHDGQTTIPMRLFEDYDIEVIFATFGPITLEIKDKNGKEKKVPPLPDVLPAEGVEPAFNVALVPEGPPKSSDEVLWSFIGAVSRRMRFDEFRDFVQPQLSMDKKSWYGVNAYNQLRDKAAEFVSGAAFFTADYELSQATIDGALNASYVHDVPTTSAAFLEYPYGPTPRAEQAQHSPPVHFPLPNVPFVELIWNYWTEEGMLVQTLNHILARFQNRRPNRTSDPLLRLDLSPLMPLRALLWGFAEDEVGRLTIRRRAAEYQYEYGLHLRGRAVPHPSIVADRRSQFLEAFHRLLHACWRYYKERDDKTVDADAFPLLSNLQELHLILAKGAHNQFANLAVTARAEMLTMQWLLAQPEMHEFLGGPVMVPYEEPWMDRVDTMKTLQGWTDTSITHFFELAVQGEQILLSVRHGRWNESTRTREQAANWALTWRNPIQRYIHSYATVTGRDLTVKVDATMPSDLIARRIADQRQRA